MDSTSRFLLCSVTVVFFVSTWCIYLKRQQKERCHVMQQNEGSTRQQSESCVYMNRQRHKTCNSTARYAAHVTWQVQISLFCHFIAPVKIVQNYRHVQQCLSVKLTINVLPMNRIHSRDPEPYCNIDNVYCSQVVRFDIRHSSCYVVMPYL